jgi:hypothetical protein
MPKSKRTALNTANPDFRLSIVAFRPLADAFEALRQAERACLLGASAMPEGSSGAAEPGDCSGPARAEELEWALLA